MMCENFLYISLKGDDTSIVDGGQEDVKCKLSFVLKDQVKKVPPWVGG